MIDLRSDTVTRPTPAMRQAMNNAIVGDDVFGEDPTVNKLEEYAAQETGKEAAIFVTSGTQSNLLGIMSQCDRGDEYICGADAHTYKYEAGGAAVLGSVQPQALNFLKDGTLDLASIRESIKPDDFHFARTRLVCLENTNSGRVLPLSYISEVQKLCSEYDIACHLDGARAFNASVKLGIPISKIAELVDTISICLSKGLGAPIGSVLCGPQNIIDKARRIRKMLGGGMRQAGIIAAGGLFALKNNVARLSTDHDNATLLATGLSRHETLKIDLSNVATNMIFLNIDVNTARDLATYLENRNVRISAGSPIRLVTHMDVSAKDINQILNYFDDYFSN